MDSHSDYSVHLRDEQSSSLVPKGHSPSARVCSIEGEGLVIGIPEFIIQMAFRWWADNASSVTQA